MRNAADNPMAEVHGRRFASPAAVLLKGDGVRAGFALDQLGSLTSIGPVLSRIVLQSRLANNSNRNKLFESLAVAYNQRRAVKLNEVLALKFA